MQLSSTSSNSFLDQNNNEGAVATQLLTCVVFQLVDINSDFQNWVQAGEVG